MMLKAWMYRPERAAAEIFIRPHRAGYIAFAPARPSENPPRRLRGYGTTRGIALRSLLDRWAQTFPSDVPRQPIRVDWPPADTYAKRRGIMITMLDEAIAPGMRQDKNFSIWVSPRGRVEIRVRQWEMQKWPAGPADKIRVYAPRQLLVAESTIPIPTVKALRTCRGTVREKKFTALTREILAHQFPMKFVLPFGQVVRASTDTTVQASIEISHPMLAGRPVLVTFRPDCTVQISSLTYRVTESRLSPGRAIIVPLVGGEVTDSTHGLDLPALSQLTPTLQFRECHREFWERINPSLSNPFVYQDHPLLIPARKTLDEDTTAAIRAAVADLLAAHGPHKEDWLTIRYQIEFYEKPQVHLAAFTLSLAPLKEKIQETIETVLSVSGQQPAGRFVFCGRCHRLSRLKDWVLVVRPFDLRIPSVSAHERMLARRRRALAGDETG